MCALVCTRWIVDLTVYKLEGKIDTAFIQKGVHTGEIIEGCSVGRLARYREQAIFLLKDG